MTSDVLSDVLRRIRIRGAVFYNACYTAPWSFHAPPSKDLGPLLGAGQGHIILFHAVVNGQAWARLEGGETVSLAAGDAVIFPHGDPHHMGNGQPEAPVDHRDELMHIQTNGLSAASFGGGGEPTRFICGYLMCEPSLGRFVLRGLPGLLRISFRDDPSLEWLETSLRFSVERAASRRPGAAATLSSLAEALFVETLGRYLAALPAGARGWMAALRDEAIRLAIERIHAEPARKWTLETLARAAGVSRTVLTGRFQHHLEEAPITYLTRWRMQLAAGALETGGETAATIAAACGYDSEAAFNRAFKRHFGVPPARFRRQHQAAEPA